MDTRAGNNGSAVITRQVARRWRREIRNSLMTLAAPPSQWSARRQEGIKPPHAYRLFGSYIFHEQLQRLFSQTVVVVVVCVGGEGSVK